MTPEEELALKALDALRAKREAGSSSVAVKPEEEKEPPDASWFREWPRNRDRP